MDSSANYNRLVKMFDEPHAPVKLDKLLNDKTINQGKFLTRAHTGSYQVQMKEIKSLDVSSVLEVGPGEGFAARNLRSLGIKYDTLDFEGIYKPTITADFAEFDPTPYKGNYELTCAFQVLEHFPYEQFQDLLKKLSYMATKYVFISVPYSCSGFRIGVHLQKGQNRSLKRYINFYWPTNLPNRKYREAYKKEFPWAVHYWEIGRKGFKRNRVLKDIEAAGLKVLKNFHGPNPFHYFILCEKK